MKKIIKDALILFAITLIAGFLLGGVYQITKEPIERQNQIKKEKSCKAVFEKYYSLTEENASKEEISAIVDAFGFTEWAGEDVEALQEGFERELDNNTANTLEGIVNAYQPDGSLLGYVITVKNSEGYGGDIELSVGILKDGTIAGVEILSISETPGLGMKAQEDGFKNQFAGVLTDSFSFTKTGKQTADEIDAITSATFTTRSMTNGVNAALAAFRAMGAGSDTVKGGAGE